MQLSPVGYVRSARTDARQTDDWGEVVARIELLDEFAGGSLVGLEGFSHVEVVFWFSQVTPRPSYRETRRSRGRGDLPLVGAFADRGPNRPNPIGVSMCELLEVGGTGLTVRRLDAIDGTPVLDLKPVMSELLPERVRQPAWSHRLMQHYMRA